MNDFQYFMIARITDIYTNDFSNIGKDVDTLNEKLFDKEDYIFMKEEKNILENFFTTLNEEEKDKFKVCWIWESGSIDNFPIST